MSLKDHTYYRCFEPGIDSDQYNGSQLLAREGNAQLAALESTRDSFETILVCLLRAYARNTGADNEEISGEALSTLSQDQLQSLVTSNTVHYDVIQQILVQKQKDGTFTAPAGYDELGLQTPPPLSDPGTPGVGAVPPLPSEQLKEIQFQVSELIRNHQVPIPPDASLDQQQMIIHQYILTHLALLQHQAQRKLGGQDPPHDTLVRSAPAPAKLIIPQDSMPLSPDLQSPSFNPQFPRNATATVKAALQANLSNQSAMTVGELTDLVGSSHASIGRVGVARGKSPTSGLGTQKWVEPNQEGNVRSKGRRDFDETKTTVSPKLLEANPGVTFGELSKSVSSMWSGASQQEKVRYYSQHEQLTQTYQTATDKQKLEEGHSDPTPFPRAQPIPSEDPSQEDDEDEGETNRGQELQTRAPMHCLLGGCSNMAVFSEDRGQHYCSNECLVKHARLGFQAWVAQRKAKA
ncbi:hypothetical protein EMCRGX_G030919 [Ephydatia muelleri]